VDTKCVDTPEFQHYAFQPKNPTAVLFLLGGVVGMI
jgi:hypothetical protein